MHKSTNNHKPPVIKAMGVLIMFNAQLAVMAATISVNGSDGTVAEDGMCSLSEAIINANDNAVTHPDCLAGDDVDDTIVLTTDVTLTEVYEIHTSRGHTGLPNITAPVVLDGQGHFLHRDQNLGCDLNFQNATTEFRLLFFRGAMEPEFRLKQIELGHGCVDGLNAFEPEGGAIFVLQGTLHMDQVDFIENQASGVGGAIAIRSLDGMGTINNSTFSTNISLENGGAIFMRSSPNITLGQIKSSHFNANRATLGGALFSNGPDQIEVINSAFINNSAASVSNQALGGAIHKGFGGINIENSRFENNQASDLGGALYFKNTTASMTNNQLANNLSRIGGALATDNSTITALAQNTMVDNSALTIGGAIYGLDTGLDAAEVNTFSSNRAALSGAAWYFEFSTLGQINGNTFAHHATQAISSNGTISVDVFENNLLVGNIHLGDADCGDLTVTAAEHNLSDALDSGCPGLLPTLLTTDSVLPLADNGCAIPLPNGSCVHTHALNLASEAIDNAGFNSTLSDQRGYSLNSNRDVGAFEFEGGLPDLIFADGFE